VCVCAQSLDTHGFGLSSVRFICGTQDLHKALEQKISEFHGTADTILYPSCFDANAGIFEALLGPDDAVISDELNHASIIDGIRLCKAKRMRYKHNDTKDLEEQLKAAQSARTLPAPRPRPRPGPCPCPHPLLAPVLMSRVACVSSGFRLIATDGVFSMDGTTGPHSLPLSLSLSLSLSLALLRVTDDSLRPNPRSGLRRETKLI
jgi:7-keto-8-aminopelargonate synthetase-like enzyme